MPDLPEVTQVFEADTAPYVASIREAIAATNDLRDAVAEVIALINAERAAQGDLAASAAEAAGAEHALGGALQDLASDALAAASAAAPLAAALKETGIAADEASAETDAASAAAVPALEQWAQEQLRLGDATRESADEQTEALQEIRDATVQVNGETVDTVESQEAAASAYKDTKDAILETDQAYISAQAAVTDYEQKLRNLALAIDALASLTDDADPEITYTADALKQLGLSGSLAVPQLLAAGNAAKTAGGMFGLSSNAIHWIISGTAELLAVLIPATVAFGAWAFVWLQGSTNIYQHMMALFDATEAWGQAAHQTMGNLLGLSGVWQKFQNMANSDVYTALGAAILLLREQFSDLADVGYRIGLVFDSFASRLVYDFSSAGRAGSTLGDVLSHMYQDLIDLGQIFGNLGAAIASFASQMPGLAEFLLGTLDHLTDFLKVLIEVIGQVRLFGWSILTAMIALEEFNRWGTLLVGLFGRIGLATTELSGGLGSFFITGDRFIGILKNLIGLLPLMAFGLAQGALRLAGLVMDTTAAAEGLNDVKQAVMGAIEGLTAWETIGIAVAAAGLGFLIYKIVTAKSSIQEFTDTLQENVQKASNLNVFSVLATNFSELAPRIAQASQEMHEYVGATNESTGSVRNLNDATLGEQMAYSAASSAYSQYTHSLEEGVADTANVVEGAETIAKLYKVSIPDAMGIADGANVKLTSALKTSTGAWTAAGDQVRSYMQGQKDMGMVAGQVGQDMLAEAAASAQAATKMSTINQAMDTFMSNATGGTSAAASFVTSLRNIGQVAGDVSNNLGQAQSISLTTEQFANSLKSFAGAGASAWTNFDQVVGSTAPQVLDWLRTAATSGEITGTKVQQAGLDMISALIPLASKSRVAQSALVALAQDAGYGYEKFSTLKGQVSSTHASMSGFSSIIDQASEGMSNMASIAENLGDVLNSQVTSAITAASLKASGFDTATNMLTEALAHNGEYGGHTAAYWANEVASDYAKAQTVAEESTGHITKSTAAMAAEQQAAAAAVANAMKGEEMAARNLQNFLDSMHGKTVNVDVNYSQTGASPSYMGYRVPTTGAYGGFAAQHGMVTGASGLDTIPMWLTSGEAVLTRQAVQAVGGPAGIQALNQRPTEFAVAGGGGGGNVNLRLNLTLQALLDSHAVASGQRTANLVFNRRNPGNYLSLRAR